MKVWFETCRADGTPESWNSNEVWSRDLGARLAMIRSMGWIIRKIGTPDEDFQPQPSA